jgi:hypothetical protein
MKEKVKNLYETPSSEVITVKTEGVICGSSGTTSIPGYGEYTPIP